MLIPVVFFQGSKAVLAPVSGLLNQQNIDRIQSAAAVLAAADHLHWLVDQRIQCDMPAATRLIKPGPGWLNWADSPAVYLLLAGSDWLEDLTGLFDQVLAIQIESRPIQQPDPISSLNRLHDLGFSIAGRSESGNAVLWTRGSAASKIEAVMAAGGCDLHLHTARSDGSDSPAELVARVAEAGLAAFAITDHDTLAGIPEAREAMAKQSMRLIPGIELSVDDSGRELHVLGYFPAGSLDPVEQFLAGQRKSRRQRNREILRKLADMGYQLDADRFKTDSQGTIGRLHIALELIHQGYFKSTDDAFKSLLGEGQPAYIRRSRPSPAEAFWMIRKSGGVAVLAHPDQYGWCSGRAVVSERLLTHLERLQKLGLQGVESFHGEASAAIRLEVSAAARALGLLRTAGSDSHGSNKPHDRLYSGSDHWIDPAEILVVAALVSGTTAGGQRTWLLTRRSSPGTWQGYWELPGGKVEPGESPEQALIREIKEELSLKSVIASRHCVLSFDYPDRRVVLICYETILEQKTWQLSVHDKARFMTADEALESRLLPADILLFQDLKAP